MYRCGMVAIALDRFDRRRFEISSLQKLLNHQVTHNYQRQWQLTPYNITYTHAPALDMVIALKAGPFRTPKNSICLYVR